MSCSVAETCTLQLTNLVGAGSVAGMASDAGVAKEIMTWDDFGRASRDLAIAVVEDGYDPT